MPELPEVQILGNQLAPRLERARIRAVESRDQKIKLDRRLVGRRIDRVRRRGKNIVFDLSGGSHLLVHLRIILKFATSDYLLLLLHPFRDHKSLILINSDPHSHYLVEEGIHPLAPGLFLIQF